MGRIDNLNGLYLQWQDAHELEKEKKAKELAEKKEETTKKRKRSAKRKKKAEKKKKEMQAIEDRMFGEARERELAGDDDNSSDDDDDDSSDDDDDDDSSDDDDDDSSDDDEVQVTGVTSGKGEENDSDSDSDSDSSSDSDSDSSIVKPRNCDRNKVGKNLSIDGGPPQTPQTQKTQKTKKGKSKASESDSAKKKERRRNAKAKAEAKSKAKAKAKGEKETDSDPLLPFLKGILEEGRPAVSVDTATPAAEVPSVSTETDWVTTFGMLNDQAETMEKCGNSDAAALLRERAVSILMKNSQSFA